VARARTDLRNGGFYWWLRILTEKIRMPRGGNSRVAPAIKSEYFRLIRQGVKRAEAARRVGVSMSCGSLWFIDAGGMAIVETAPISSRILTQDDRIEIADGLVAGEVGR
jgi:IS30 family transposase